MRVFRKGETALLPAYAGTEGGHTGPPLQNMIFESDIP